MSARPGKVLMLSETLAAGGAETFAVRLANGVARDREVVLAVIHGERVNPAVAAQLSSNIRLEMLRLPAKKWLWKVDSALRRAGVPWSPVHGLATAWFRRLVARERPLIIHSHLLKADWVASRVRRGMGDIRHVITIHGDYASYLAGEADPLIARPLRRIDQIFASADRIVAIAREQIRLLSERFPDAANKLDLIYNGYAPPAGDQRRTREDLGLPRGKFLFGMVARGVRKKGWAEAVAAFEALNRPEAALVLVGEGPFLDELRCRGVPSGILFVGFSGNPLEYVRCFDVCLLPTLFPREALPTVIMEYLFCGKPVIATAVGEIPAMLALPSGEIAGRLLDFDNGSISVAELTELMREMLDQPAQLARMAAARSAFEKFDMDRCIARYREMYENVAP